MELGSEELGARSTKRFVYEYSMRFGIGRKRRGLRTAEMEDAEQWTI